MKRNATRTDQVRQLCRGCGRHTAHKLRIGHLQGQGKDAFQMVTFRCQFCGFTETIKRYPNLLSGVS